MGEGKFSAEIEIFEAIPTLSAHLGLLRSMKNPGVTQSA